MNDQNNHQHHYNSLEFFVTCETNFGEQLRICGNSMETGNWNSFHGHRLVTDNTIYPEWKSYIPLILRNNAKLQFKACKISENKVVWQKNIPNRQITCQDPSTIKFIFDEPGFKTMPKKITEIDCRDGTFQILNEMESSETSSIQFRANYPFQYYFETQAQKQRQKQLQRKYSDSELSSNLFSQNDLNINNISNQKQSQAKPGRIHYVGIPQLFKAHSIRPRVLTMKPDNQHNLLHVSQPYPKNIRSRSKSLKKSDSGKIGQKQQIQSPIMVHVPDFKDRNSPRLNDKKNKTLVQAPEKKGFSISTKQVTEQDKSTTTLIQYDSDNDYFLHRDQDVAIQTSGTQFEEV